MEHKSHNSIVSQFQTEINLQDLLKLNQVSNRSKKQKVSKIFYYYYVFRKRSNKFKKKNIKIASKYVGH